MSAPGPKQRLDNGQGGKDNWRTPDDLFGLLNRTFGPFTIDGAASPEDAKCDRYYTDAFTEQPVGETIFVNPPYGSGWKAWIALFAAWGKRNNVIALVPSSSDTEWWRDAHEAAFATLLLSGRVRFIDPETGKADGSNTTGSTVFLFRPGKQREARMFLWDWRKALEATP